MSNVKNNHSILSASDRIFLAAGLGLLAVCFALLGLYFRMDSRSVTAAAEPIIEECTTIAQENYVQSDAYACDNCIDCESDWTNLDEETRVLKAINDSDIRYLNNRELALMDQAILFEDTISESDDVYEIMRKANAFICERAVYNYDAARAATGVKYCYDSDSRSSYGALCDGYALCAGYAKAFAFLMRVANVEAYCISGYAFNETGNISLETAHTWNIVKIGENDYIHTDITWDDRDDGTFTEDYLFLTPQKAAETRTWFE